MGAKLHVLINWKFLHRVYMMQVARISMRINFNCQSGLVLPIFHTAFFVFYQQIRLIFYWGYENPRDHNTSVVKYFIMHTCHMYSGTHLQDHLTNTTTSQVRLVAWVGGQELCSATLSLMAELRITSENKTLSVFLKGFYYMYTVKCW